MCLFWLQTRANAQSDSTDLTFEFSEVVYESDSDSIFFPADLYSSLSLAFDISDTTNFGKLHVELSIDGGLPFYKKSFTFTQLVDAGIIDEFWHLIIPFGNVVSESPYKVSVVIEDYAGLSSPAITKHI